MFVKKDHYDDKIFTLLIMLASIIVASIVIPNNIIKLIIAVLILFLYYLIYIKIKKVGIYVEGAEIIINRFVSKKKLSVEGINAIAIVKSIYRGKYKCSDLKDSVGNQLYTILVLADHVKEMYNYKHGDFTFMVEFKDYVLGDCVFDERFIKWLLKEKPQIKIIDNRS